MITWGIIWGITLLALIVLIPMEIINGSIEVRFWVCVALILFLIITPIFTFSAYNNSKHFYEAYTTLEKRVSNLSKSQEYMVLGEVMNYNYYLYQYQTKIHRFGIFAPYYRGIWDLEPIQLNNFDMNNYRWWDD